MAVGLQEPLRALAQRLATCSAWETVLLSRQAASARRSPSRGQWPKTTSRARRGSPVTASGAPRPYFGGDILDALGGCDQWPWSAPPLSGRQRHRTLGSPVGSLGYPLQPREAGRGERRRRFRSNGAERDSRGPPARWASAGAARSSFDRMASTSVTCRVSPAGCIRIWMHMHMLSLRSDSRDSNHASLLFSSVHPGEQPGGRLGEAGPGPARPPALTCGRRGVPRNAQYGLAVL